VLLACLCECFFHVCPKCVCVRCVFGGGVWRLCVCVRLREMCVGVGVVVVFPFCGDGSGGVAGVFCECVVVLRLYVDCFFVFLPAFLWGLCVSVLCLVSVFVFCGV